MRAFLSQPRKEFLQIRDLKHLFHLLSHFLRGFGWRPRRDASISGREIFFVVHSYFLMMMLMIIIMMRTNFGPHDHVLFVCQIPTVWYIPTNIVSLSIQLRAPRHRFIHDRARFLAVKRRMARPNTIRRKWARIEGSEKKTNSCESGCLAHLLGWWKKNQKLPGMIQIRIQMSVSLLFGGYGTSHLFFPP